MQKGAVSLAPAFPPNVIGEQPVSRLKRHIKTQGDSLHTHICIQHILYTIHTHYSNDNLAVVLSWRGIPPIGIRIVIFPENKIGEILQFFVRQR